MRRFLASGCLIAATITGGGCNQILGTGDPSVRGNGGEGGGDSATAGSGADTGGTNTGGTNTGGAGAGGAPAGGGGAGPDDCYDPEWAQWKPNGGPVLTSSDQNWTIDEDAQLAWLLTVDPAQTWPNQLNCVTNGTQIPAGFVDGPRRPTRIELLSLIAYETSVNGIDETFMGVNPSMPLWTSSEGPESTAWTVRFADVGLDPTPQQGATLQSLCVAAKRKAPATPPPLSCRFETVLVNDNVPAVKDKVTGLTWGPTTMGYPVKTYPEAKTACLSSGWALPQLHELLTLLDVRSSNPAWAQEYFGAEVRTEGFWTKTPDPANTGSFYALSFTTSKVTGANGVSATRSYLCVK